MKRNKLLIPTLSALAVAPAIAVTSCSKDNTEQNILDAIFGPMELTKKVEIADYKAEFEKLSEADQQKELIYSTFGTCFCSQLGDEKPIKIYDLYKNNEGAFKINITKCSVHKENGEFYGTLLGYVSYIFEKEHQCDPTGEEIITFKTNDYLMITFDMVNTQLVVENSDFSLKWKQKLPSLCLGFIKFKYNAGGEEGLCPIDSAQASTADLPVKNSHNWVPKA